MHEFAVQLRCNQKANSENWMASCNWKVSSEDAKGFFLRVLALYVPKFQNSAVFRALFRPSLAVFTCRSSGADFVSETQTSEGKVGLMNFKTTHGKGWPPEFQNACSMFSVYDSRPMLARSVFAAFFGRKGRVSPCAVYACVAGPCLGN